MVTEAGTGPTIRLAFDHELGAYRAAKRAGDPVAAWRALERAHIVSQTHLLIHMRVHLEMLRFAISLRDWPEILGQLVRLALAPLGSLTGRIPIGNTGRSTVSAFTPMPIPNDLLGILKPGHQGESRNG